MRIGIDAKWFFNGNPSGKRVVRNLLKELIELNSEHEIYVILDKKDKQKIFPLQNNKVKLIYIWGKVNLLSNLFIIPILLTKYKIDVCVCQYFVPIFCRTKKIVFIHDIIFKVKPEFFTLKEKLYFLPVKFLARHSNGIITVSYNEKRRIEQYHFSSKKAKVFVIYNGVEDRFKTREHFSSKEIEKLRTKFNLPEKFLLYVGRLNERKNILSLLMSIKYLSDPKVNLVLAGSYDRKMFNLKQKINHLNLNKRVHVLGYINDDELPLLYSMATIFCYVSFDEGFGLPPLESMAAGVPVIVSNTSSLHEVCGNAGTYCIPEDPIDIANKINSLLSDSRLYAVKKQISVEYVKKFNWKKSARMLLRVCEKIVKNDNEI